MSFDFDKNAAKGNEFVLLVAEELKVTREKAARIIRSVFHALRNRLTHEESFQLMGRLPVALKGMYVDGWRFDKDNNRIAYIEDFVEEVRKEDAGKAGYDFSDNLKSVVAIVSIFKALNYFVSEEEMNEVTDVMPAELKKFIRERISGGGTIL